MWNAISTPFIVFRILFMKNISMIVSAILLCETLFQIMSSPHNVQSQYYNVKQGGGSHKPGQKDKKRTKIIKKL